MPFVPFTKSTEHMSDRPIHCLVEPNGQVHPIGQSASYKQTQITGNTKTASRGYLQSSVDESGRIVEPLVAMLTPQVEFVRKIHARVDEGNPWEDQGEIGDMENFKSLFDEFPLNRFQWGIAYTTLGPEPVIVCGWNRVIRIVPQRLTPDGDHGDERHAGTLMLTCGTDDSESKGGFYHRYVDHLFTSLRVKRDGFWLPYRHCPRQCRFLEPL
jgi:hypothetical protein